MAMTTYDIAFTENPTFKTVTGLTNKTWSGTATSGRAATEDQLAALAAGIESDTNTVTTVAGSTNINVTDAGTEGNHAYTVATKDTITGLSNKTWSGTATSGRAATEDQLAAALPVVAGGTGIDSVTPTTSQGKTTYTVNAHEYEVTTSDPNIIITVTTA